MMKLIKCASTDVKSILHTAKKEGRLTGLLTSCVGNCLLKQVIEGNIERRIEVTGRRRKRSKQLLDGLKERRRCWKMKEGALDRSLMRSGFVRGCVPGVRQTGDMNE